MIHIFDNAKQTRQFWVTTGSSILFAFGMGDIFTAKGLHIFIDSTMMILSAITLVLSLKEIYSEKQSPNEVKQE